MYFSNVEVSDAKYNDEQEEKQGSAIPSID
jgi:hypothetical protein